MLVLTFTILLFGVLVLLLADRWRHSRGRERVPRCMGSIVFEKNERHAAWERLPKMQNERYAAWERSAKMQNKRHAAWEYVLFSTWSRLVAQDGSPNKAETICFKVFVKLLGAPSEHPVCAH